MTTLTQLWQDQISGYIANFLAEADARVQTLEDEITSLRTQLAVSEQDNSYLVNQINGLNTQITQLQAEVAELRKQLEATYDDVVNGNVQAVLDAKPEGATIKLAPEVYRINTLAPKNNQKIFAPGATFKGSVIAGTWLKQTFTDAAGVQREAFVASGVLPALYTDGGVCEVITGEEANACRVLEDVFLKGNKLTRVMTLKNLTAGKVYSDYSANKVYILDQPDNVEISKARFFMNSAALGVRVSGATVSHFAAPSQQGALTIKGRGWEVDNCFFTLNHASGLHVTGGDSLHVHHSTFDKNGQAGMTHHKTNDSVIEYNVFTGNNTSDYYRRDWESAGIKITYSQRVKIQFNRSESNLGIGVWVDIDNKDISITDNVIKNNFSCGIRWEISFDGVIARNIIIGNGFGHAGPGRGSDYSAFATAAIHFNGAGGMDNGIIDVYDNKIGLEVIDGKVVTAGRGNQNAIHIEERNRGKSVTYPTVNWTARNIKVHDNMINMTRALDATGKPWYGTGVVGLGVLGSPASDVYAAGNTFEGNKYYTNNVSDVQFHVKDTAVNQYKAFARWQALGYDKTGSITAV